jgi:chromosome partitioning protein
MQVIVLASRKGGVGKTTLAGHLAVHAERAGAGPVAVIDMDEQGSLASWWNARKEETPSFARVGEGGLQRTLDGLRNAGTRLVVIDTPPYATDEIGQIVRFAGIAVVPVKPSPHDLRAVGETVDVIESAKKPFVFVINEAPTNGLLTLQAMRTLSKHGRVAAVIKTRQDFRSTMIKGSTVQEIFPKGKSASEIAELWGVIDATLNKQGAQYEPAA